MNNNKLVDDLYAKIFARSQTHELGVYQMAAYIGFSEKKYKLLFFNELNEQINASRKTMLEIFGEEIVNEIINLNLNPKDTFKTKN